MADRGSARSGKAFAAPARLPARHHDTQLLWPPATVAPARPQGATAALTVNQHQSDPRLNPSYSAYIPNHICFVSGVPVGADRDPTLSGQFGGDFRSNAVFGVGSRFGADSH